MQFTMDLSSGDAQAKAQESMLATVLSTDGGQLMLAGSSSEYTASYVMLPRCRMADRILYMFCSSSCG